jgi:hypothetical protein
MSLQFKEFDKFGTEFIGSHVNNVPGLKVPVKASNDPSFDSPPRTIKNKNSKPEKVDNAPQTQESRQRSGKDQSKKHAPAMVLGPVLMQYRP